MTIFESTQFEISQSTYNFAKEIASKAGDEFSRKRIYESIVCMKTLADYFQSEGYSVDSDNSLYKILPVNIETELTDFRCNGRCIDVIPVVNEKYVLIPKSIYKYGILPDLFAIAKYNSDTSTVNFIGCIEPLEIDKRRQNEKYFIMDISQLIQPFQIEDRIKLVKNIKISDQNHDLYASYFIDYCDDVLSDEKKKELFKHLAECKGCRGNFIEFIKCESVVHNASKYPEMLQDQMLNIVGAADVNNEKYKDFQEITLEIDKEPDKYNEYNEEEIKGENNYDDPLNVLYGNKSPNNEIFNSFNQKSQSFKQKKPKSMLDSVMAEIPKLPVREVPPVIPVPSKIDISIENKTEEIKAKRINPSLYEEDFSDGIQTKTTINDDSDEFDYIEDIVTPEPDPAMYNDGEDTPLFVSELNPKEKTTNASDELLLLDAPVAPDVPEFANYLPQQNLKMTNPDDEDIIVINDDEIVLSESENYDDINENKLVHFDVEDVDITNEYENKHVIEESKNNDTDEVNEEDLSDIQIVSDEFEPEAELYPEPNNKPDYTVNKELQRLLLGIDDDNSDVEIIDTNESETTAPKKNEEISDNVNPNKGITSGEKKESKIMPITDIPGLDLINTQPPEDEINILDITNELAEGVNLPGDFSDVNTTMPDTASNSVQQDTSDTSSKENELSLNLEDDLLLSSDNGDLDLLSDSDLPDIPLLEEINQTNNEDNNTNAEIISSIVNNSVNNNESYEDEDDEIIIIDDTAKTSDNNIKIHEEMKENFDNIVILDKNNNQMNLSENKDDSLYDNSEFTYSEDSEKTENNDSNIHIMYNQQIEPLKSEDNQDEDIMIIEDDETNDDTVFMRPASVVDIGAFEKIDEIDLSKKETPDDEIDDDITFVDDENDSDNFYETNITNKSEDNIEEDTDSSSLNITEKFEENASENLFEQQVPSNSAQKEIKYDENGFEIEDDGCNESSEDRQYQNEENLEDITFEDNTDFDSDNQISEEDEFEEDDVVEDDENDEENEEEVQVQESDNRRSNIKNGLIILFILLILLGGAGGGLFFFMKKAKQEQMQNIEAINSTNEDAPENTENNLGDGLNIGEDNIQLPEEGENKDLAEQMPPQENNDKTGIEEEKLPQPPTPAEQKPAPNPEKAGAKDMNQAMTNAFSDNPSALKITKTSWAVSPYIAADTEFKTFLQTSGRAIQAQIKKNLISVKNNTYSENTKIQISFSDGLVSDVSILKSSGSEQIDDIVLQSVKEYMTTATLPKLSENTIQSIKNANGGYKFKITFSVNF